MGSGGVMIQESKNYLNVRWVQPGTTIRISSEYSDNYIINNLLLNLPSRHFPAEKKPPGNVKNATPFTLLKQRFDSDHISIIKRMTQK
jgi:hypothetical protein